MFPSFETQGLCDSGLHHPQIDRNLNGKHEDSKGKCCSLCPFNVVSICFLQTKRLLSSLDEIRWGKEIGLNLLVLEVSPIVDVYYSNTMLE